MGRCRVHRRRHCAVDVNGAPPALLQLTAPNPQPPRPWWAAAALVALAPVALDPTGWNRFAPIRWLVAGGVAAGGVAWLAAGGRLRVPRTARWCFGVLLAVIAASVVVSPDPRLGLLGDSTRTLGLVSWVVIGGAFVVGTSAGADGLSYVLRGCVGGALVVSLYGLAQLLHLDPLHWPAALDTARARSTFGNAGLLGGYLVVAAPVAVVVAVADRDRRWRVVSALTAAMSVIVLVGTGTRGAWLGGAVACIVLVVLGRARVAKRARIALIVAAIGLVAAVPASAALHLRAGPASDLVQGSTRGRIRTWDRAAHAIAHRPVLGWGADEFRRGIEMSLDRDYVRHYGLDGIPDRAHNLELDTLGATGVVGLLTVLALGVVVGRRVLSAARRDLAAAGVAAGLAGYLVHAQFLFLSFDVAVVIAALAGAAAADDAPAFGRGRPRAAMLVAGAFAVATIVWGIEGVASDHRVNAALRAHGPAAMTMFHQALRARPRSLAATIAVRDRALQAGDPVTLAAGHLLLRGWNDPDVVIADGDVLSALGAASGDPAPLADAKHAYGVVLRQQPVNALAWLGLGETDARLGDANGARLALTRAADLQPRSADALLDLGLVEVSAGRADAARAALAEARRRAPYDPRLASLADRIAAMR